MFKSIILLLTLVSLQHSLVAALTAKRIGGSLVIRDGKTKIVVPGLIEDYTIYFTVHAVQMVGKDCYVVYGVSEPSRPGGNGNGHCGAGIESYIRWLHIQGGKVVEQKEGLHVSCFKNRDGWNIEWKEGKLLWYTGSNEGEYTWTYDPTRPEIGIAEVFKAREAAARP